MVFSNKILLLIPNLGLGGAQRVFHDHSVELAKHYAITEAVFNLEGGDLYPSGNPVVSLDVSGGGGPLDKLQNFQRRVSGLRQLRERLRPAIVISHLEGADYVNLLSGGPGKTILCVHGSKLHDANIRGPVGWLRKKVLIPMLYRRAARIVTVSTGIREELVRGMGLPAHKIQVINNFFDVELIRQQADALVPAPFAELANQGPVLVTSGRLSREKNLLALLDVFQQVRRQLPTCRLLIIGQGEEYLAMLARCQALGLAVYTSEQAPAEASQAAVLFAGFQANPHAFIAKATLFVLPSLNEGFPMALGEAMVCGLPVVAADCPTGPREILSPATPEPAQPLRHAETAPYGVLLPVISNIATYAADVTTWSQTLTTLLLNPIEQDRLREQARHRMNDFSRQHIAGQWLRLVEEVRQS
ncbi:glycosyltransferase [Hymenobacter nivis]|nr:glycosyltransferase [Hymenobacter nivis]